MAKAAREGVIAVSGPWTVSELRDLSGTVFLVTGANRGVGRATAEGLARAGAHVVLACRNGEAGRAAAAELERSCPRGSLEVLTVDLADLGSIRESVDCFTARHDRLDGLVNNAAVLAPPMRRTAQGFELQFGVNHLGHFALAVHLIPLLLQTRQARVVTVSSNGHRGGRIDFGNLNAEGTYSAWGAYFQSKLANLLFSSELQRRLDAAGSSATSVACHPGAARTALGSERPPGLRNLLVAAVRPLVASVLAQPPSTASVPSLRAATDLTLPGDAYIGPGGMFGAKVRCAVMVDRSQRARDQAAARRLWDVSERLTGVASLV